MKEILKQITKANRDYNMINDQDKLAVGFSGGVDSVALVVGLDLYRKRSRLDFQMEIFYMDMGFEDMDIQPSISFLKTLGYDLHIIPTQINDILKLHPQKHNTYSCSICSRLKKGYFIDHVKPLGFNKVAFAHHGDDAIETLFLNMIYGGKIATFRPIMHLSNQDITFIRPLVYTFKKQIISYQAEYDWPVLESTCPNNHQTQRDEIRGLINTMIKHYPLAHSNLLRSIYNNQQLDLWNPLLNSMKTKKKDEST